MEVIDLLKSDTEKKEFAKNVCDNFKASMKMSKLKPEDVWVEVRCDSHYLRITHVWRGCTLYADSRDQTCIRKRH